MSQDARGQGCSTSAQGTPLSTRSVPASIIQDGGQEDKLDDAGEGAVMEPSFLDLCRDVGLNSTTTKQSESLRDWVFGVAGTLGCVRIHAISDDEAATATSCFRLRESDRLPTAEA